jgi:glutamate-1-semialdehyde aminotransferase
MNNREISQPIFDRALNVLAQGVSSNFRYWGPKETPIIAKGKGGHVWDADGNKL